MEAVSEACDLDNYFKLKVFPYPHCLQYFSSPHSHHPPPFFLIGFGGWGGRVLFGFCLYFKTFAIRVAPNKTERYFQ